MKKIKLSIALFAILLFNGCSLFWSPNSVVIDNPEQTVKDARAAIDNFRKEIVTQLGDDRKHGYFDFDDKGVYLHLPLQKEKLPQSLKIPGLMYAMVCYDHVDLVFQKNPEYADGLRIWSLDTVQKHKDKPTKYKDIFSHSYMPDDPTSPDNIGSVSFEQLKYLLKTNDIKLNSFI